MRFLLLLAVALLALPAQAQDPGAEPTYGDVHLDEGFQPDPYAVDLRAGGDTGVRVRGCEYGTIAEAPDVDLYYSSSGSSTLYIYAVSNVDTMILVNLPNGSWTCDDDSFDDGDPLVIVRGAPDGLYDIWVGTFGDDTADARLFISEIDPR